jgi:hypothetical protein
VKFTPGRVVYAINHTQTTSHFPQWSPHVIITCIVNLIQSANQVLVPQDHIFIAMGQNCMLRESSRTAGVISSIDNFSHVTCHVEICAC